MGEKKDFCQEWPYHDPTPVPFELSEDAKGNKQDIRCGCGHKVAEKKECKVEIQCKRCKQVVEV